jgi:hypothetical protein
MRSNSMAKKKKTSTVKQHKQQLLVLAVVIVVVIGSFVYWRSTQPKPVRQETPRPTITSLPAKGNPKPEKSSTVATGSNPGTGTDTTPEKITTKPTQWSASKSGVVVVQNPIIDQTIKPDAILSGTSSANTLQYRLIDDDTGIISEGSIDVKDGKFSVSMSFKSHASTGRLDVFTVNSSGVEEDEVQIKVNF